VGRGYETKEKGRLAGQRLRGRGATAAASPAGIARVSVPAMRGGRDAEIRVSAETLRAVQ